MGRSIIEYTAVVWSSFYRCHADKIESVQKRFLCFLAYKSGVSISNDSDYRINYAEIE